MKKILAEKSTKHYGKLPYKRSFYSRINEAKSAVGAQGELIFQAGNDAAIVCLSRMNYAFDDDDTAVFAFGIVSSVSDVEWDEIGKPDAFNYDPSDDFDDWGVLSSGQFSSAQNIIINYIVKNANKIKGWSETRQVAICSNNAKQNQTLITNPKVRAALKNAGFTGEPHATKNGWWAVGK